jgi:hypothetical protein
MQTAAKEYDMSVIGVDIGGATTDVFSVFGEFFNRTVSANLGMSYSICNVLLEAGVANIERWIPFTIEEGALRNRIRNKMIRPTTIPQTLDELIIEQAIAREALRLAFEHHKSLAVGLRGVHRQRTIGDTFEQTGSDETYIDMAELGMLIGSGGCLSHAPRRAQAAMMLIDAFQPESTTMLAVDSIFMMPQLGILASIHPKASMQVFDRDCLVKLGTAIAPKGPNGKVEFGSPCLEESVPFGSMKVIRLSEDKTAEAVIRPTRHFDVGKGYGHELKTTVNGGVVGVIIDCRGRPVVLPEDLKARNEKLVEWFLAMNMYPKESFEKYVEV